VLHWNPRVPGNHSLEFGRALASVPADVILISNPGRMTRPAIAEQWLPEGWSIQDCGPMGLATRLPVESVQVLTFVVHPFEIGHWMVRVHLRTKGGTSLEILCVDLPSGVHLLRPKIAHMVRDALAKHPDLPAPDLIVGDFNNEPGSRVFEAFPESAPPTCRESCGWLCSFPRLLPLWRIDGMRTGPTWEFQNYQTIDLGVGLHRAQLGVVIPKDEQTR
jgi:endonuclease/exonuclease/phosphatase family metal-dependent hydrolase